MAITYVLTQRKNPQSATAPKRWYAKGSSIKEFGFNLLCDEASHASSATRGDVLLALDASIASMVRHLSEGETVQLGDFGRFRMEVHNTKKVYNELGEQVAAAPVVRDEFRASRNICGCRIVFTPGAALKNMCKTASYQLIDGGTPT